MKTFESYEVAYVERPTARLVIERIRRDRACKANPLSACCILAHKEIVRYLVDDVTRMDACTHCPVFESVLQGLMADWEDWVLRRQDVLS